MNDTTDFWALPAADRLARVQADQASHVAALEELQPALDRANERLASAQADYDAAAAALGANQMDRHGAGHATNDSWRPDVIEARKRAAEAEAPEISGAFQLAEERLATALVARNGLDARRSAYRQQVRLADTMIASTEAELARERAAAEHSGDVLRRIRDRVGGAA